MRQGTLDINDQASALSAQAKSPLDRKIKTHRLVGAGQAARMARLEALLNG